MIEYSYVGKNVSRVNARVKVTGEAVFCDDIKLPGMLYGKIKRSPHPFARILSIDISENLPGVRAVVTSRNITQFSFGPFIPEGLPPCS